jgi:hypothetical protein
LNECPDARRIGTVQEKRQHLIEVS